MRQAGEMKKYGCTGCDGMDGPEGGGPGGGVGAGRAFEDIPEEWVWRLWGVGKDQFE